MFHGISIVVQGCTVRQYSDKVFLMSLRLVCDTKMSTLNLKSKRVICPSTRQTWKTLHLIDIDQANNIPFFDRIQEEEFVLVVLSITSRHYAESLFYVVLRLSIQNENKSQQVTCIHTIWGSTLLSISFHLNFFLVCESKALSYML